MRYTSPIKLLRVFSLCAILGAVAGAPPVRAADLYVVAGATAGDGSKTRPFSTITEALAAADKLEDSAERIVIRVAAGTYKSKAADGKEEIPAAGWSITQPIWVIGSYQRDGGAWKLKPHDGGVKLG
jgi:pectin methylesterase-like acyl-CoA thioesterase